MQFLDEVINLIDKSIKEDAENIITAWNIIKDGFDTSIDSDRKIVLQSHEWLSNYQKKLIEESSITSLKIKFTNNTGYFIEVPKSQTIKIPKYFIARQALTQSNRYTTVELQEFEKKIFSASSELHEKEYHKFIEIRHTILWHFWNIYKLSRKVAFLDFISNGAYISLKNLYNRVEISSKYSLNIKAGRHPVISKKQADFISNDIALSKKDFVHIITWPNMWWKSTYLRQNALLILMSHMGYDIPCDTAKIWLVDKIFSRIWSGDNIYLGQSTFMVEMQEIWYILRNSTKKSFVIIDEIGRWTSTYDGMSLAWSILQYNYNRIKAKTLFATHYHEIIDHAHNLSGVSNYSVAVWENNENIIFLRKIIPGGIKKSYGIEVAKLAWIPEEVLKNSREMMEKFQSNQEFKQLSFQTLTKQSDDYKQKECEQKILSQIKELNLNSMPPIESLQFLYEIQKQMKKNK